MFPDNGLLNLRLTGFFVHNRVDKQCISKQGKIWNPVLAETIFDVQLHGILAIKGSAESMKPLKRPNLFRRNGNLQRWK